MAIWRLTISLPVSILAWFILATATAQPDNPAARAAKNVKVIIAHRGASLDRPENTLASYRRAIEVGATATECDIRTTKDGVLVSVHDDDIGRTSNGKGHVAELTLAELRQFDFGSWFDSKFKDERIPTLQEILDLCRGKIDVMIDLKDSGQAFADQVAALVRKYGEPKRTILGIRSTDQARQFRKLLPESRQIGLIHTSKDITAFAEVGVETIRLWPKWLADPSLVAEVRKHKKKLLLGAGKGLESEVLPLLAYQPEYLSSDDPAQLIQTLAATAGAQEKKNLEGTWVFTKTSGGPGPKKDGGAGLRVVFKENTIAFVPEGNKPSLRGAYTIDAGKHPKTMDIVLENKGAKLVTQAIFELEGDNLKLCHYLGPKASKARPTAFAADEQTVIGILKRAKD